MRLAGRNAIVTGASEGLGYAIAEHFLREGAKVAICARNGDKIDAAGMALAEGAGDRGAVLALTADVSRPELVDAFVAAAFARFGEIDILVNNAGVYGPMGALEEQDWLEWAAAVQINIFGVVYPCRALLPAMRRRGYGKIINLSGGGATNPMPRITAYAASKAAVVRFTESLALEVAKDGIDVNAIAPGALATRLTDEAIAAGPSAIGEDFYARLIKVRDEGGAPLERGAALCAYLASAESDGITGRLISALWDPWETLHERRSELASTDIYTLRRIVPEDRGRKWS